MLNVDLQNKDAEIREVLSWLREQLGSEFQVIDHWDADRCAIGVAALHDAKRLAYISSWNRPSGRYFVELETAPSAGSNMPYTSVHKFDAVDRKELVCIVAEHLNAHP